MAEYKDIWYADGSEKVSAEKISYNQAVSVGDKLEKVFYNTPIVCTSDADVVAAFPTPKQGDKVYRVDLAKEFMYFETYNSLVNDIGRLIPGWYPISGGLIPVVDDFATSDGDSTEVSRTGRVTFDNARNVTLPRCFTSDFTNYKIVINVTNIDGASGVDFRFVRDFAQVTTTSYMRSLIASETATVAPAPSAQAYGSAFQVNGTSILRSFISEITLFNATGTFPKVIIETSGSNNSTAARIQQLGGVFNNASPAMEGFLIRTNQTNRIDGSIEVFGYN
jgi:hypothetical protein